MDEVYIARQFLEEEQRKKLLLQEQWFETKEKVLPWPNGTTSCVHPSWKSMNPRSSEKSCRPSLSHQGHAFLSRHQFPRHHLFLPSSPIVNQQLAQVSSQVFCCFHITTSTRANNRSCSPAANSSAARRIECHRQSFRWTRELNVSLLLLYRRRRDRPTPELDGCKEREFPGTDLVIGPGGIP